MSSRKRQPGRKFNMDMALAKHELAQRMRAARTRAGKSQDEIAEAAGVSLRQYNRYETAHSAPREKQIPSLAAALGVPVEHLDEPQQQTVIERLERQQADTAAMVRSALGLLDQVLAEVRKNRDSIAAGAVQVSSRLDLLETRVDAHQETLTQVQREFLQALGAPAPPPATDAPGQATNTRPTSSEGTPP
jgi:transcriptional regulator with XRE-family HTH domain